jgi:hypothetical protein
MEAEMWKEWGRSMRQRREGDKVMKGTKGRKEVEGLRYKINHLH